MKHKIILFLIFCNSILYAQNDVYVFKDVKNEHSINTIENANFTRVEKSVSEKHSDASYWFKIPADKTSSEYIFRILYEKIQNADVYKNTKKLEKLNNQRFISYQFSREHDVFIKINPKLHAYIMHFQCFFF